MDSAAWPGPARSPQCACDQAACVQSIGHLLQARDPGSAVTTPAQNLCVPAEFPPSVTACSPSAVAQTQVHSPVLFHAAMLCESEQTASGCDGLNVSVTRWALGPVLVTAPPQARSQPRKLPPRPAFLRQDPSQPRAPLQESGPNTQREPLAAQALARWTDEAARGPKPEPRLRGSLKSRLLSE
ncbi:unnamed protein product [Rangifer tarandus platyrhynchus]|uniref:Uncharacterized protein n=2 Tax=Rangifer tarandus platyrhynchus TaxID=3082113 RepID=A0ABN8Y1K4_RANTA|nr:unnamed protein product [Rangifer tarandus platyrhynchus]CAI9692806.1 unnamed protein product [Rangifer tarandus platyrhynchus]